MVAIIVPLFFSAMQRLQTEITFTFHGGFNEVSCRDCLENVLLGQGISAFLKIFDII